MRFITFIYGCLAGVVAFNSALANELDNAEKTSATVVSAEIKAPKPQATPNHDPVRVSFYNNQTVTVPLSLVDANRLYVENDQIKDIDCMCGFCVSKEFDTGDAIIKLGEAAQFAKGGFTVFLSTQKGRKLALQVLPKAIPGQVVAFNALSGGMSNRDKPKDKQNSPYEHKAPEQKILWDSAFGKNFTDKDNQSALKAQQIAIDDLAKDNKKLASEVTEQQKALDQNKNQWHEALQGQVSELRQEMLFLKENQERALTDLRQAHIEAKAMSSNSTERNNFSDVANNTNKPSNNEHNNYDDADTEAEFLTFHISARHHQNIPSENDHKKTVHNYVPTGTFCRAVILGGADANAGVNSQSNTTPINFKILDHCHLPNGKHSKLKGAFVTAAVFGDISSERGEIKLDRLSFIHGNGEILDISVEGTAFDVGGKAGIRGIPVLKNGKIVQMAVTSGLFSGLGDAAKSYAETQSVSALGSTTTLNPAKVPLYGAGSGLNTAFAKISDYYIKLADQYHPIVELRPGAVVDLLFLKGFSLDPKKAASETTKKEATQSIASNILDQAKVALEATPEMPVPIGQMTENNLTPQTAEAVSNHINDAVQRGNTYV